MKMMFKRTPKGMRVINLDAKAKEIREALRWRVGYDLRVGKTK